MRGVITGQWLRRAVARRRRHTVAAAAVASTIAVAVAVAVAVAMQPEPACVEFKFKSDHAFERVALDGGKASLTAVELRQIVTERRLNGAVRVFGLKLSDMQTGEEFVDDALINAGTSVLIRRVPLSLQGVSAPRSAELIAPTNFASSPLLEKLPERRPVAPAIQGPAGTSQPVHRYTAADSGEAEAQRIQM